jgi:type II secretory pathway pseudopilin PulG
MTVVGGRSSRWQCRDNRVHGSHAPRYQACSGFSVIEVIVVVVLLTVIAGVMAPRLSAFMGRQVRADAQAAGDLLSVAARRDVLTSQQIAVEFDAKTSRLRLMTLRIDADGGGEWVEDSLAPPVRFNEAVLEAMSVDGVAMDPTAWRVEFPQGSRRPSLDLKLAAPKGSERWRVALPTGAAQAIVRSGEDPIAVVDGTIDLDDAGQGTSTW